MPVSYTDHSAGPTTRALRAAEAEHSPTYYEEISVTGAAAELADELGVDLSTVTGTGKDGNITKADVKKAAGG